MIDTEVVKKVADLSKIDLNDDEIEYFTSQFSKVMEMIDTLKDVECSEVEPLVSINDIPQRFRKDSEKPDHAEGVLFKNVPHQVKDIAEEFKCFVAPKVVDTK